MGNLDEIFNWVHNFGLPEIIGILFLVVLGSHFLYFVANRKKISFLYKNSVAWIILRNLFFLFIVILLIFTITQDSLVLSAIATSYIVSFVFYEITSVNARLSSDEESLKQTKMIAYCKTAFEGIHFEVKNMPCNLGDSLGSNIENCESECSWNQTGECTYYKELLYNMKFLERRLNSSLLVISVCKPELINPFSVAQSAVAKAVFCLENNIRFRLSIFKEIDEAHNFFTREGDSGSKNTYSDADVLEKRYREYYADCLKEVKLGKPSNILEL